MKPLNFRPPRLTSFFGLIIIAVYSRVFQGCHGRRSGSRILNGEDANIMEYPFYGLMMPKYRMFLETTTRHYLNVHCGASLISPRFFVTANHCFMKNKDPNYWIVLMGVKDRCMYDGTAQIVNVAGVFPHPAAKIAYKVKHHDIALVQADRDIYGIPYINLPMFGPQENERGVVIGFGLMRIETPTGNLKDLPCQPQKAFQYVPNQNECRTPKENIKGSFCIMDIMRNNASACRGDSGGPYFTYRNNSATILGVSSFGDNLCRPWRHNDHYTNVFLYVPWILSVISFTPPQSIGVLEPVLPQVVPIPQRSFPVQLPYQPNLASPINAMPLGGRQRFNALIAPKLRRLAYRRLPRLTTYPSPIIQTFIGNWLPIRAFLY